ncbi:MAG: porphobilinogen synthase [Candidatus Omnitrophica bacterium]|nr:porphobilinogen synthase [Candidatus Omnitrophota bacterium]
MKYPLYRPRRLRADENYRRLIRETGLSVDDLVMPFFVREGNAVRKPIAPLPGNFQLSIDNLIKEVRSAKALGIPAVLLFGIPDSKDGSGSGAYAADGIVQRACSAIRQKVPGILVITDVCLCEFTSHGHCGVLKAGAGSTTGRLRGTHACGDARIDNDATLELLAQTAVSHAEAGADMVAPSAMMDGQVRAIRSALDAGGYTDCPIMAYSAKYASAFYGPFRRAAGSAPQFGDRRSYQMDIPNAREALREIQLDIKEGADIVMVKPALAYLDIIARARQECTIPVAAYNVSGEFAMVKAAARMGWLDESRTIMEVLTAIKRAGATIIITYHAMEAARMLRRTR